MMAVYFISASMFSLFAEDTGKKPWPITIQEILPVDTKPVSLEGMYNPLKDIKIKNGNFIRNGKPVFLCSEGNFGHPDVCKILGIDMVDLYLSPHTVRPNSMIIKTKNEKIDISFRQPKHIERAIRELLKHGLIPYVQFVDGRRAYAMKTVEEHYPGAFMPKNFTPYLGFNDTDPIGHKIRKSYWQNIQNITNRYPVFIYEMFNEIPYSNGGKHEQNLFRKHLADKFKTVVRMNELLNTDYETFAKVSIPNIYCDRNELSHFFPGISENMFTEWCVFQTRRSGEMAKFWYDMMGGMVKNYPSHLLIQSYSHGGQLGYDPREKVKGEDVFGAETYSAAFDSTVTPELLKVQLMAGPAVLSAMRAACPDKPIHDCEGVVGKGNPIGTIASVTSDKIVDLVGTWKFADGTDTDGQKAGWHKPDFADDSWDNIKVPGMWGKIKKYKKVQVGWYRRTFDVPKTVFKKYPRLYLSGKELTDKAFIYLNGKYLYTTKKWNELLQVDVTDILKPGINSIAIRVENRYFRDGMYFGGIRKFLILTDQVKDTSFKYTSPTQLKRFLWNQVLNGYSGKCLWHTPGHCRGIPDHGVMYTDALRSLPIFKMELNNVADIVMPRPRIKGRVALYWPYETQLSQKYTRTRGVHHVYSDIANVFGPLLLSGIPLDLVNNQSIKNRGLDEYQLLAFVHGDRVDPAILPTLRQYVQDGGIVLLGAGSLRINHDWYTPLAGTEFLGITQLEQITKPYKVVFKKLLDETVATTPRSWDGQTGWRFTVNDPAATTVIAQNSEGVPAIVRTKVSKGAVYYMGADLDFLTMNRLINTIIDSHKLQRDFTVALEDKQNTYIESHLFTKGGRQVWHFTNWNGIGEYFRVHIDSKRIPASRVVIRNVTDGKFIKSPDGNNVWTKKELQGGLKLFTESSGTLVLLVEKAKKKLRKLEFLSPRHQKLLTDMFDHNIGGKKKAMYLFESGLNFIRLPAVNALLRSQDYQIDEELSYHPDYPVWDGKSKQLAKLIDYDMVLFVAPSIGGDISNTKKYAHVSKDLLDYVKEGGNLLFCGKPMGILFSRYGNHVIGKFTAQFNLSLNNGSMRGKEYFFDDPLYVIAKKLVKHPITTGVGSFYCSTLSNIRVLNKNVPEVKSIQPLIRAQDIFENNTRNYDLTAAAIEYGKGKIVVVNGCRWMESQELKLGDNAQFFLNILNWFENKPSNIMNKKKLHEIVDLSF